MKRPFKDKRILGPVIDRISIDVSAPIAGATDTQESVCGDILDRKGKLIDGMVSDTDTKGREQVVILVEVDGEMLATDVEEGREDAITRNTLANLSMDASMLAINARGGGELDPRTINEYEIHTHPEGHIDFSTRDLTSIGNNMFRGRTRNIPDGHFVAVKDRDDILLHGVHRTRELTEEEVSNIKSVSETVESMGASPITESQRKQRVIDELLANGYEACASTMQQ